ncbi:GIY-YIG nuclease family protein [Terasakiella sp. A23]|uniref:GIY-YIG nuclease family protein n=1 Tax=Terasakiella sp. FCG-A23 TaxID=3080561 RepID=UPI0029548CC5|nr:GIY-YIG nuclease family protein [Terasakiella sp. A23]MDV7338324.1 GIY-YIG nuclease family protein [Terasakiella sp. A23]
MMKRGYVYILSNKPDGVLYVGVTSNLEQRIQQHKNDSFQGFSSKYKLKRLVYVEETPGIADAIHREKCIKRWKRDWKIRLIEEMNPEWKDLSVE